MTSPGTRGAPPDGDPEAHYRRAAGSVAAFLIVGLFVKYAELLYSSDHRNHIPPQGTLISRAAQVWLSLRFSWQEFAIATVLLIGIAVWQWFTPRPTQASRLALRTVRGLLMLFSLLSVFGIAYYAVYQTHITADDAHYIGWLPQLVASLDILSLPWLRLGVALWVVVSLGLPWIAGHFLMRMTRARAVIGAISLLATLSVATFVAGRPNLAEAMLEPNPTLWMIFGHRVSYVNLPPAGVIATLGESRRRYQSTEKPRNVIVVILESTPAAALFPYAADAPGGRRLIEEFGGDVAVFEQVFAVVPNSAGSLFDVLMGQSPLPSIDAASAASAGLPGLGGLLKARGFHTEMLQSGAPLMEAAATPGFDRALTAKSDWPNKSAYARLAWGIDDRMLFDTAQTFLRQQTSATPPFLLMLYANNPHVPYSSDLIPGLGDSADPKERHRRLVRHDMDLLTEMYASMKQSGLADTTAIIAFGDHGEAFNEHPGNLIHGNYLYDENVHVPLMLIHPRRLGLPARVGQLGSLDDVLPTICDLLGIDIALRSGMSLLFDAPERVVLSVTDDGPGQVALRDRRFTYLVSRTGREMLFDRIEDPGEQINLRDTLPDVAERFRSRLLAQPRGPAR